MSTSRKKKSAPAEAPEEAVETLEAKAEEPEVIEEAVEEPEEEPAAEEAEAEAEPVAYIGPTIRNVISSGRVLVGGLPPALEKKIEEIPALRGLIVPVSELSTAMQTVKKPKTALNNLYAAVSEKLKK